MSASLALRGALFAAALLLLWRILSVNAVTYGEANTPVLRLPAEGAGRSAALLRELSANPASPAVLVALGVEHERSGDPRGASRAFASALRVAPIDRAALQAGASIDAREGRLPDAVRGLDRLLTYYGETREWIFPLLLQWLAGAEARSALVALAREPSSWMGAFVTTACGRADAAATGALLERRVASGLAGKEELRCGIEALRRAGHWDAAYQVWLNSLPRERLADVGFVFNGGFEHAPSGHGFDWIVDERSAAHVVDIPQGSGRVGSRALRVAWTGKRIGGPAIWQVTALRPGRYELAGLVRLESLQSVRGIHWTMRCEGDARAILGRSARFMGSGEWEPFAFAVEVPPACAGQRLQLEPVGLNEGTVFVSGRAWFDDLRVSRLN
jgi:hypothetical protein